MNFGNRQILFYAQTDVASEENFYLMGMYAEDKDGTWYATSLPTNFAYAYPDKSEVGLEDRRSYQLAPPVGNQVQFIRTS